MKDYFYVKENKAYIIDKKGEIIIEDVKDNTEETLILQNNIESINNLIETANEQKSIIENDMKSNMTSYKILTAFFSTLFIVLSIISLQTFPLENVITAIILEGIICLVMPQLHLIKYVEQKQSISYYNIYLNELENALNKEKGKLKNSKEKAIDKSIKFSKVKRIPRSEVIKNLKNKKDLILSYKSNQKEHITYYKNNAINKLIELYNYNENDIEFIKKLIEQDLENFNNIHNDKFNQKVYKPFS